MARKESKPVAWYVADFETNVSRETCAANPVWAWGLSAIEAETFEEVEVGTSIDSFMERIGSTRKHIGIYFHNLKFDASFILNWLLKNGYTCVDKTERGSRGAKVFTCLRANGSLYALKIAFKYSFVTLWDSAKKIPLRVEQMPKAFGLDDICKGDIDYELYRPPHHKLTANEESYLKRDVLIVAQALSKLHSLGVSSEKMTIGSDAYEDWRTRAIDEFGESFVSEAFESLDADEWFFAAEAYNGGITTPNPKIAGKMLHESGRVYDVNSMYPGVMLYKPMPVGKGTPFEGAPQGNGLWIASFDAFFFLKAGAIPVYRPRHYWQHWPQGVMMRNSTDGEECPIRVTMTSVDFWNYSQHYDILVTDWVGGYYYPSMSGLFDSYINYWGAVKVQAGKDGNKGLKQVAKYKLNNLYGKFGQKTPLVRYVPELDDDGALKWCGVVDEGVSTAAGDKYMPIACFITAYAREILCKAIRAAGPRFCYADTDSVHVVGDYEVEGLDVDPYRLGAWDWESSWDKAVFHRPKAYAEHLESGWDVKLAGCPKKAIEGIDVERDFKFGAIYHPKLVPKQVDGGCILVDIGYEFKERV